jgi:hypothetical protein
VPGFEREDRLTLQPISIMAAFGIPLSSDRAMESTRSTRHSINDFDGILGFTYTKVALLIEQEKYRALRPVLEPLFGCTSWIRRSSHRSLLLSLYLNDLAYSESNDL